ncbi:MAG TPA: xanthine dehydrogenase family protein molybdopterin-binding subunit [Rhizomicrobium sp.]|nr:xanthine dehydrogenase family protein molybdopterin-binding subunit [Rhizomicrobium sp.]
MTSLAAPRRILGEPLRRIEDIRLLRGEGSFVDNLGLADALHVTFVRSTIAHAKIAGIDCSAAKRLGARVFTAADADFGVFALPPDAVVPFQDPRLFRPFLARDKVRFVGEIVAVVVTESHAAGLDAVELVDVEYDELPVVVDPRAALRGEVILFPDMGTNVVSRAELGSTGGEIFTDCDTVVSGTLVSPRIAPLPLEPRSAAVAIEGGRLTVWLTTQMPNLDRDGFTFFLGLDPANVRVVGGDVDGAFGAKGIGAEEVLVAWAAKTIGRPVRWTESRSESLMAMRQARGQVLAFKLGGSRDGKFSAYKLDVIQDAGAYPFFATYLPVLTGLMASGVYDIPKVEYRSRSVVTNTMTVGPTRGAGRAEAAQAIERAVDLFAAELGMDTAELRFRNMIRSDRLPHTTPTGARYDSGDYAKAVKLTLEAAGYDALRELQRRRREEGAPRQLGIGISAYVEVTNHRVQQEFAAVELTAHGEAILRTGSFSHGQGHETTFAMIIAERLGLPLESVRVIAGDTDQVPRGLGTYASKSAQIGGVSASTVAIELVERARLIVGELVEASADDIVLDRAAGRFHVKGTDVGFTWAELADKLVAEGRLGDLKVDGDHGSDAPTYPSGAHVAVVEVDIETGAVEVHRVVALDDAGTVINPLVADGQVHGGIAMGIGQALFEEVRYDERGTPLSASLASYRVPCAADLPSFELLRMETPTPFNALGVKGIGESGTVGVTPAIQNAVVDALLPFGIRHVDMPITPERVWRAIRGAVP